MPLQSINITIYYSRCATKTMFFFVSVGRVLLLHDVQYIIVDVYAAVFMSSKVKSHKRVKRSLFFMQSVHHTLDGVYFFSFVLTKHRR